MWTKFLMYHFFIDRQNRNIVSDTFQNVFQYKKQMQPDSADPDFITRCNSLEKEKFCATDDDSELKWAFPKFVAVFEFGVNHTIISS